MQNSAKLNNDLTRPLAGSSLEIEQYYNDNQILYTFFWSKTALHYGFWDAKTKSFDQSLCRTTSFVADCLDIQPDDLVLDAGCGVGGSAFFIAQRFGARVVGITLSQVQLKKAIRKAVKLGLANKVLFLKQDFNQTDFPFPDRSFSKIMAIESVCYAESKYAFLKKSWRLLRDSGRIAIADGFLARTEFTPEEKRALAEFLTGWVLPNLETRESFEEKMLRAGFCDIKFFDKNSEVRKSSQRIWRLGLLLYLAIKALSFCRIIPKSMLGHARACLAQKMLFERGIVIYGVFTGEKI